MCSINASELHRRLQLNERLNILDVREAIEYHTYNIGGLNIPVNRLQQGIDDIAYNKTDEIIVICSAGIRSKTAQAILLEKGFENVMNLKGGLIALQKHSLI